MVPNAERIGDDADRNVDHRIDTDEGGKHGEEALKLAIENKSARGRRMIEFVRGMMDRMECPEQADPVIETMIPIISQFVRDERRGDCQP